MSRTLTPLLDRVCEPQDLRAFPESDLARLADELRAETIDVVSVTGGHLGAGLGVIELTVALHYVFNTPEDRIIWDVGHQAYPHKILTGRREKIRTLRQEGDCQVLQSVQKVYMIHLVQGILLLLFQQVLVWRWQVL